MISAGKQVFDGSGQPVVLAKLLGRGGEGSVFDIAGDAVRVGKIYHVPDPFKAAKLTAMARMSNPNLTKISAWPERTLHMHPGGAPIGFVMPRAGGTNLSDLLGPGSRKIEFPDATYGFVVRAALNLAKAFAVTHAAGAVVGDVKEVNEVVDKRAIVTLVDTDGFQIRDAQSGQTFRTLAVTPTHQPPELQGIMDFANLTRTPDQDAFGLAVLIFQLLFMGRHPFTGVPVAGKDLEIPQAIKALQFSWAPNLPQRLYKQPPATLSLASVGPLGPLFIRAFLPGQPGGRPSSAEWAAALTTYETLLKKCPVNPAHSYGGPVCPLCQIEVQTSTLLFLGPLPAGMTGMVFDINALWGQIGKVASPGAAPALPALPARTPVAQATALGKVRRRQKVIAVGVVVLGTAAVYTGAAIYHVIAWWVLAVAGAAAWIIWAQGTSDAAVYSKAKKAARERFDGIHKQWEQETGDLPFKEKLRTLEASRDMLRKLESEKAARLQELRTNARQHQLDRFLQTHRIANARIPNIGSGRVTTLRSYSIETALDVTSNKLAYVHGFGPVLQGNLFAWRDRIEKTFQFDPAKGADPRDLQDLDREFVTKRSQHEQLLRLGPLALKSLADQALSRRQVLAPHVQAAQAELAQAEANAKAAA